MAIPDLIYHAALNGLTSAATTSGTLSGNFSTASVGTVNASDNPPPQPLNPIKPDPWQTFSACAVQVAQLEQKIFGCMTTVSPTLKLLSPASVTVPLNS
jgi:hypothetical protein